MKRAAHHTTLIGFGAIGEAICLAKNSAVTAVVVRTSKISSTQAHLAALGLAHITVTDAVPSHTTLVLECAGHSALQDHVVPALRGGISCAVLSVGALTDDGLAAQLEQAAHSGGAQLHLLAGAIGGIDAIASAKHGGIPGASHHRAG
jgi:aspartate dehydrogenase